MLSVSPDFEPTAKLVKIIENNKSFPFFLQKRHRIAPVPILLTIYFSRLYCAYIVHTPCCSSLKQIAQGSSAIDLCVASRSNILLSCTVNPFISPFTLHERKGVFVHAAKNIFIPIVQIFGKKNLAILQYCILHLFIFSWGKIEKGKNIVIILYK